MWNELNGKLEKNYKFKDFVEAWGFLCKVAILSEKVNHHPAIKCTYNEVSLSLFTHDEGKITDKDKNLAKQIDEIV